MGYIGGGFSVLWVIWEVRVCMLVWDVGYGFE